MASEAWFTGKFDRAADNWAKWQATRAAAGEQFAPASAGEAIIANHLKHSLTRKTRWQAIRAIRGAQWGAARKMSEVAEEALTKGCMGMAATLSLPPQLVGQNRCPPRRMSKMISEIHTRWQRALEREGINLVWYAWVLEPHGSGLPHGHVLAMVPEGMTSAAFDALARSIYPRERGKPRRYARKGVLGRSGDVTRSQIPARAIPPAYQEVLGWVAYAMKNRLHREPAPDRADLITTLGWIKHFSIGRAIRRATRKRFEKRLKLLQDAVAETKPPVTELEPPVTASENQVICPLAGESYAVPPTDKDAPSSSGARVQGKRERDKAAGLVRVSIEGVSKEDAAVLRAAAAAAKAGGSMTQTVTDVLTGQGRGPPGVAGGTGGENGALRDEADKLRASAREAHASVATLASAFKAVEDALRLQDATVVGLRAGQEVAQLDAARTRAELEPLRAELAAAKADLAAAMSGWAVDQLRVQNGEIAIRGFTRASIASPKPKKRKPRKQGTK